MNRPFARIPMTISAAARSSAAGWAVAVATTLLALMLAAPGTAGAGTGSADTVKISGTAYAFFDIDDRVPGAVVRVEEYPKISDAVAADGSYEIEVPDDANVTPYIEVPAGYRGIYLQTFHTSGRDLRHVNFQVVPSGIYAALAGLLGVPLDESGQVEECVIVSTFSIHEARDATSFDPGFKDVYPHGLPGATGTIDPVQGNTRGPIYFNEAIIPDPAETSSSVDGGVLWVEVPPGYYWMEPTAPDRAPRPVPRPLRGRAAGQREPALGLLRAQGRRAAGPGGAGGPARHHRRGLGLGEAPAAAEAEAPAADRRRGQGQGEGGADREGERQAQDQGQGLPADGAEQAAPGRQLEDAEAEAEAEQGREDRQGAGDGQAREGEADREARGRGRQ